MRHSFSFVRFGTFRSAAKATLVLVAGTVLLTQSGCRRAPQPPSPKEAAASQPATPPTPPTAQGNAGPGDLTPPPEPPPAAPVPVTTPPPVSTVQTPPPVVPVPAPAPAEPAKPARKPCTMVFVVDMLRSMNVFVADLPASLEATFTAQTQKGNPLDHAKFALWGYRGVKTNDLAAYDWGTTSFSQGLESLAAFRKSLNRLQRTEKGDLWVDGAVLGLDAAINRTPWDKSRANHLIWIGDSSTYAKDDPRNQPGKDETMLRLEADRAGLFVHSLFIVNPRAQADHAKAQRQFQTLADNSRVGGRLEYYTITGGTDGATYQANFRAALNNLLSEILDEN